MHNSDAKHEKSEKTKIKTMKNSETIIISALIGLMKQYENEETKNRETLNALHAKIEATKQRTKVLIEEFEAVQKTNSMLTTATMKAAKLINKLQNDEARIIEMQKNPKI